MRRYLLPAALLAIPVLMAVSIFGGIPSKLSWGRDAASGTCINCHSGAKAKELGLEDVYAGIQSYQYRHSAVEQDRCDVCHIISGFKSGRKWEVISSDNQKEQMFFLKDLSADRRYEVNVRAADSYGKEVSAAPVMFIPSKITSAIGNDQKAPVIQNVSVMEIKQGVFIEAVITWETDEPSNSIVDYGLSANYGETASSEKVFATGHKISMTGLRAGQKYHYRITSRDIFGNAGVSNAFILDTSAQISRPAEAKAADRTRPSIKDLTIFKINGTRDIYLKLVSDRPVKAVLTVNEPAEMDKHGFGLVSASYSRIDACVKCHSQGASHPVGIRSKGIKTKIPSDVPTVDGGVITCVSCHTPHGGNKKFFARFNFDRDLCIKCHTGAPFV